MSRPVDLTALIEYVQHAAVVYRKGDEVYTSSGGALVVDAFPALPEGKQVVDCHFVSVGFTEYAPTLSHQQFYDSLVANADGGVFGPIDWRVGPSYISIGGWIGDQTLAFRLMALGEAHGVWTVVTPASLGIHGPAADQMAGGGLVLVSGLHRPEQP